MTVRTNSTSKKFYRLTAISKIGGRYNTWLWKCECGKKKEIRFASVASGNTKSCGCLAFELKKAALTTHGRSGTYEYTIWAAMKRRCYNPNVYAFHRYGGRGIYVCDRWRDSFQSFYDDMGPCPEGMWLDRKNNNGPYIPGNCKWSVPLEQQNNKSSNVFYALGDKSLTLAQWCKKTNVQYATVWHRLSKGWPLSEALFTVPKHSAHYRKGTK